MSREKKQAASKDKNDLGESLSIASYSLDEAKRKLKSAKIYKDDKEERIAFQSNELKKLQAEYSEVKELVFDETKTICPVCQSEFSADKKEKMIADFETDKASKMLEINKKGKAVSDDLKDLKIKLSEVEAELVLIEQEIEMCQKRYDDVALKIDQLPKKDFDVMECKEYLDVLAVIEQLQKDLSVSEESVKDVEKIKRRRCS